MSIDIDMADYLIDELDSIKESSLDIKDSKTAILIYKLARIQKDILVYMDKTGERKED